MSKTIADNIKCCNCSINISDKQCAKCDEKCYYCSDCYSIQYINIDGKTTEGHNIICKNKYNCTYCGKATTKTDKDIIIEEFSDDFIFDIDKGVCVKYSDDFYHFNCLCEFHLCYNYTEYICNNCKKYCKDITNMRDINISPSKHSIYVCIECFDGTDIRKCYNDGCDGKYAVPICCYEKNGDYNYAMGCENCSCGDNWINRYCETCE